MVVYRNGSEVQDTLNALALQTDPDFEIIIIDNDCPDRSTDALTLPDERFRILPSVRNLGFAGGCNLGAKGANSPWLIMLNPDAQPHIDWLENIRLGITNYEAAMFGSTQIMGQSSDLSDGFGDVWSIFGYCWRGGYGHEMASLPRTDRHVLTPCAAASVYRRDIFERVGGFDDTYFCYLEDVDLGLRMQAAGSKCIQLRQALVRHIGGSSEKPTGDYALMQSTKNTPRLIIKNAPLLLLPIMLFLFMISQIWFRYRNRDDPQSQQRWAAVKLGWSERQDHFQARRKTSRNSLLMLSKYLAFGKKGLRQLPVKSLPPET